VKRGIFIFYIFWALTLYAYSLNASTSARDHCISLDDVILDIYNAYSEIADADYEQIQQDLYALHEEPVSLNSTSDEELARLYFLSPQQIDDILAYADRHPFESLYELRLIPSLTDYEIRNLLPFVTLTNDKSPHPCRERERGRYSAREVFANGQHELVTRLDARNMEGAEGADMLYAHMRYVFRYRKQLVLGAAIRPPVGREMQNLQGGAWMQMNDIGPMHTLVAGNYQASFGQGLVFAPSFHAGKSAYAAAAGLQPNGLRYRSSLDDNGLHGVGTTMRWNTNPHTRIDLSALYSLRRDNDTVRHHVLGANITVRHKQLDWQITAAENIWSDSIRPYRNTAYNRHYFRGYRQAVLGTSLRYNFGIADLFTELATAQNYEHPSLQGGDGGRLPHWGFAAIAGCRLYPMDGVAMTWLYRYYSPFFDNALGYAFSETPRLGDEHGGYLGFDITRLRHWRFYGYADFFRFSGPKYRIPDAPSLGYDLFFETRYLIANRQSPRSNRQSPISTLSFRLRARKKGDLSTYSARAVFLWQAGNWSLRTTAEANLTPNREAINSPHYGFTVYQDIAYSLLFSRGTGRGLDIRLRMQAFDCRNWDNRIYACEHDVLYAFSVPATYGVGARAYLTCRWQILTSLALYLKLSETFYLADWAQSHDYHQHRTDIHLLIRTTL